MFSGCNSWENCNFPQEDSSFYDDNDYQNYNQCESEKNCYQQQQQPQQQSHQQQVLNYYNDTNSRSPTNFSQNSSPTNEQCINLSNHFYAQSASISTTTFNNGKNGQNNNNFGMLRHHPYQRESYAQYQCSPNTKYFETFQRQIPTGGAVIQQPLQYQQQQQQQLQIQQYQQIQQIQQHQHIQQQQFRQHQFQSQQSQRDLFASEVYPDQQRIQSVVSQPFYSSSLKEFGNRSVESNTNDATYVTPSAPCKGNQPWTYAYCYGYAYNNQEPCQYTQFVDIEDFMNNEKRKEKSRDAARFRRSRETEIFSELALVLPLKKEDITQLDKASVMRIAIANLKIRGMLDLFPKIQQLTTYIKSDTDVAKDSTDAICTEVETETEDNNGSTFDLFKCAEATQLLKQTLDGFLIILSNDGDITYVSDNITEYLGIAKIDILGQQIWEYSHQCDHVELEEALNIKRNGILDKIKDENLLEEGLSTDHRDFFVRLKCTLTSRGRSINIKSASYKVIHITGHLVVNTKGERVLIAIGRPIPHPSNIEIPLGSTTFLTKHSLDMKFTYVDDKMLKLFGYESEDLLGKSMYGCYHGADSDSLMGTFKTVLSKGQGETCRYRFLGKHGGYCWIVTQATIVYDKLKPQSVVCVNYVIR
ncbi:protein similar [Teleopsis dalmanni]|uniref:protein similar n=1 Tax=Teleopsis dalmanni TaxID=139649 RepID=UPI0018CDC5BB|nr:protein similar [Teleopsis dalmanni]